jgi:hypothetical protein
VALGSTKPLREMSTRNLPGSKGRPARKVDNPTDICGCLENNGSLDVSQPYGPLRPVTGKALPFHVPHTSTVVNTTFNSRYGSVLNNYLNYCS